MHLNVNIRTPIARENESDFVVQMLVDVLAPTAFPAPNESRISGSEELDLSNSAEHLDSEFVVGRIWAERLDWLHAEEAGFDVLMICDEASATWMQVLETLTRNGGRKFRRDLNLENFISDIVFVHEILLHPEIQDRTAIVDAALRSMTSDNSLVLMHHEQSLPHHLEDAECNALGFKKIARSNLLLKDNHFRYPFGTEHVAGRAVDFTATAEHENWLLETWEHLIADHPSL